MRDQLFSSNQLFTWRKLADQGALTATRAAEEVVPVSAFRAQQDQIRELQRLLGQKTLEAEILKEALDLASPSKNICCARSRFPKATSHEAGLQRSWREPFKYRQTDDEAIDRGLSKM